MAVAIQSGFHCYFLSPDSIAVYGNREGDYFYRLMSVGFSEVLELGGDDDFLKTFEAKQPHWIAPRMKKPEFVGFRTTQGIFGNILLQLICRYHPCEKASFEECEFFHRMDASLKIQQYAPGLSPAMQDWLSKLLEVDPQDRHETPQLMLMAFAAAQEDGENYV